MNVIQALSQKMCVKALKQIAGAQQTLALMVFISFRFCTVCCSEGNYSPYWRLLRDGVVDATKIEALRVNTKHYKCRSGQSFSFIRILPGVYIAYIFQKEAA